MSQHEQLQRLLLAARSAVKAGEARRALALLEAALRLDPRSALAYFTAGQAHAALGAAAAAAAAFGRCAECTAHATPGTQQHALHQTATDNLLLESEAALPPNWIAALHDEPRLAALKAGIAAAVQQAAQQGGSSSSSPHLPPRVLVCGGLGLEAVLAAQAGAQHVSVLCQDNPLTARLAAELAADSGCGDRVTAATAADQLGAGQQTGSYNLVILADALGSSIDWALLQRQLAAVAPLLAQPSGSSSSAGGGGPLVLPHAVHICGQLVECAEAVALNEVDVAQLAADTGGLDLSAANQLLPRARRSVQLPAYRHAPLSSPATLLTVPLASLLPSSAMGGSSAGKLAGSASLALITAGSADALCWWLEQQLTAGNNGTQQQAPLLSSAPGSCSAGEAALHPHIWQHLEYLDRLPLAAGQAVNVRCWLGGGSGSSSGTLDASTAGMQALSLEGAPARSETSSRAATALHFDVQLQGGGSAGSGNGSTDGPALLLPATALKAVAAAVPVYHTSMLNDWPRTVAYRDGIAVAVREAGAQAGAAEAAAAAASQPQASPPLVLEIGSGSGLLLLLARQAGAAHIIGCERLPELQQVAARLLEANGAAHSVTVLPKHSRQLTVAEGGSTGGSNAQGSTTDLPRRAAVLLHEIFGTDPFSEGVVPSLVHARQHLLAPGAVLAPCKLHVVAAVAASSTQGRLLRPAAAICGGAVRTAALRQLAPRKVDCKVGQAEGLFLLTEPAVVLSVDFSAAELPLADSATALLECLQRPLSMSAWAAAQRQQGGEAGGGQAGAQAAACSLEGAAASSAQPLPGSGAALFAVAWFEYEFPGGVRGSTAPHLQRSEHWQQVVLPLEGAVAEAALAALLGGEARGGSGNASGGSSSDASIVSSDGSSGSGSNINGDNGGNSEPQVAALLLTAGYRVDRLWVELAGIAAAAGEEEESGEDD
ncbi:hypothetical protein COHA_005358 [Chlorella ohadii]|uniref:Uncharacterized protein n=1 Tax=Chlorella ohadii TaxID=2649997 RepID=A0AAD5DNM5_9CHLO|nr:hypothetical protein COHA_005358 [Chlorella ohadii]